MVAQPTGTVSFLFTDIQGSTNLVRSYPDAWPAIKTRHRDLLRAAFTAQEGFIFQTIGDEIDAAFSTASAALAAAIAAQHSLHDEDWGQIGSLHVRMGIHTGPAAAHDGEFEGYLTLSHAKRLMSLASGGQILLSEATDALLREQLPQDVTLRDLGEHRMKDFEHPEHIFQVVAKGLPDEFAPLKSQNASPNHLPLQLTSFIGRTMELSDVRHLLAEERLVTLTGPGGSGKTRLALQAAARVSEHFQDGVYFVALAPVTDPGLVPSTIAQALGIKEAPGRSVVAGLQEYLHDKSILLLLDNFEQVIAAAPVVADLLTACTEVKVLITSREGLHVSGEHEYLVPPLALPDPAHVLPLESLADFTAIALFIQRAQAVKPDFRLTNETAPAVAEICSRLDGLPLAIELAAARVKLLSPRAMLARMENRLGFLTGGARDLPARQQTLRSAIAWSYDLLNQKEQTLFRRLSVFVGGCTIEAVEAVAGDPSPDLTVLDQLGSLLDKSLLQENEGKNGEPRFVMFETLREFGLEQLRANGEQDTIRSRHVDFYLALAGQAEEKTGSPGQVDWMNQMEQEHGNLRAALEWTGTAEGMNEKCQQLAGLLGLFWEARGYYSEGRERIAAILSADLSQGQTPARARLLARAAELAYRQSDYPATTTFAAESLAIYRQVGDRQGIASALVKLGNAATEVGDFAAASGYLEEALMTWRDLADKHGTARALISLGWVALRPGDFPLAKTRLEEALSLSRELGDTRSIAFALSGLGEVALRQGDLKAAARLVEESLDLRRQLGNKWGMGVSLGILGLVAMHEEDWAGATARLGESLSVRREIGDQSGSAWCLERLAEIASAQGQAEKAVRLFGAGAALRASIHSVIDPTDQTGYEKATASLRAQLGEQRYRSAWEEGQALSLEQAADYALDK